MFKNVIAPVILVLAFFIPLFYFAVESLIYDPYSGSPAKTLEQKWEEYLPEGCEDIVVLKDAPYAGWVEFSLRKHRYLLHWQYQEVKAIVRIDG